MESDQQNLYPVFIVIIYESIFENKVLRKLKDNVRRSCNLGLWTSTEKGIYWNPFEHSFVDQLGVTWHPLMLHEGVGIPRVMVHELTRQGTSGSDLETMLYETVDEDTDTSSNWLPVHVDPVIVELWKEDDVQVVLPMLLL